MKFGLFSVVDHYPDELDRTTDQFYHELIEQAVVADELGFDSFWLAEHHFHPYGVVPRPAILLSAIAGRTHRIRLGAAVVVLSFDDPVRVAEDYALLDRLSNGRVELGVGSGYLQHEFDGFGVPFDQKRERFDEGLDVLRKAWTGEPFSHDGVWRQAHALKLNVTPVQRPHPPLRVAILSNQAAVHVGRRGLPIMTIPYATTEEFHELSATATAYREGLAESGPESGEASIAFGLHTFCAPTREEALRIAAPAMERYVRSRLYAKQRPLQPLIDRDLVAFGSPGDLVRIAERYEEAGLTHFLAMANFGGLEHEAVLRSMELMARAWGLGGRVD